MRAARPRAFQVSAQSCRGRRRCRVGQVLQPGAPSKRNAFLSAMHALEHVPQTESVRAASASSSSSPSKTEQPSAKLARRRQPRNESSVLSGCTWMRRAASVVGPGTGAPHLSGAGPKRVGIDGGGRLDHAGTAHPATELRLPSLHVEHPRPPKDEATTVNGGCRG